MSVIVAYKYAGNPQDAKVNSDGVVDWARVKKSVSEYDPVAVELAKKLAAEDGGEVVGISVGGADLASSLAKKNALSKGLDRALVVADDATGGWSNTRTALALAELVKKVADVKVVFTGDASVDGEPASWGRSWQAPWAGRVCSRCSRLRLRGRAKDPSAHRIRDPHGGDRRAHRAGVATDAVESRPPR